MDVVEQNGARDVIYEDVYENGASISTKEISSKETKKPVRGVIRYGTKVEPKVGSGAWRWPLDNAYVLCGYGCYPNHSGTDFQHTVVAMDQSTQLIVVLSQQTHTIQRMG